MKVVLVHGKYFNSWEAQGLGWIASYVGWKIGGMGFQFFQGCFDLDGDIWQAANDAEWVLFSCTSPTYEWARRVADPMKRWMNCKTVIGGYHASAVPQSIGPEFDHVVIGDGEEAVYRLVSGETRDRFVLGQPMRFDELQWPNRELIRNERNIAVAQKDTGKRITSFQSHRGCPHGCRFCCDGARKVFSLGGQPTCRARDIDDLLNEIESVHAAYRLDFFKFCDATWNLDLDWVKAFCRQKIKRGITLPYFANIHAALIDDEMVSLMAASGCQQIGLGIESGSDYILRRIGKGITKAHVRNAVALAKRHGIWVRGYFILGVPEETEEHIQETEQFAEELDLPEVGFSMLCPYPGSDYYHRDPRLWGTDWTQTDEYHNSFWGTATISNARLQEIQGRLVAKFKRRLTQHQRDLVQR